MKNIQNNFLQYVQQHMCVLATKCINCWKLTVTPDDIFVKETIYIGKSNQTTREQNKHAGSFVFIHVSMRDIFPVDMTIRIGGT